MTRGRDASSTTQNHLAGHKLAVVLAQGARKRPVTRITRVGTCCPCPLEQVEGEERRELVRAGVDRLPDFLKQVLILAYYQGLKYSDIAQIMGIPVGTVKSRLHSALVKLQEFWAAAPSLHE